MEEPRIEQVQETDEAIVARETANLAELDRQIAELESKLMEMQKSKESEMTPERIGEIYVNFCKKNNFALTSDEFDDLKKLIPGSKVAYVFRASQSQEEYFSNADGPSTSRLIRLETNGKNYLLPLPINRAEFDTTIDIFDYKSDKTAPSDLTKIIPATVILAGQRWNLETKGQLI